MQKKKRKRRKGSDVPPLAQSAEERLLRFSNSAHRQERQGQEEIDEDLPLPKARDKVGQALGITIFLLFLVLALGLIYFIFRIETIEVSGAERYSALEIAQKSGIALGDHMWLINISRAEEALERDPYIKEAGITRVYPSQVTISVKERKEAAVIEGIGTAAVIDKEGYVLSIGNRERYDGLIRVYGAGAAGYQLGQKIGEESDFIYRTLVSMLDAIEEYELENMIESIDLSNALAIKMTTFSGYTVQMGQNTDIPNKIYKLYIVLPALESLGYTGGTLNVSVRGDPVYSPPETEADTDAQQPESEAPEADEPQGEAGEDEAPENPPDDQTGGAALEPAVPDAQTGGENP